MNDDRRDRPVRQQAQFMVKEKRSSLTFCLNIILFLPLRMANKLLLHIIVIIIIVIIIMFLKLHTKDHLNFSYIYRVCDLCGCCFSRQFCVCKCADVYL